MNEFLYACGIFFWACVVVITITALLINHDIKKDEEKILKESRMEREIRFAVKNEVKGFESIIYDKIDRLEKEQAWNTREISSIKYERNPVVIEMLKCDGQKGKKK